MLDMDQELKILEHKHLVVRAMVAKPPKDPEYIKQWFRNMIESIGMKIVEGPISFYSNMIGNRGLTCMAIIETSHCTMHVWDEVDPALLEFDVYTCSSLNIYDVLEQLDVFEPMEVQYMFLDREYDLTVKEKGTISR